MLVSKNVRDEIGLGCQALAHTKISNSEYIFCDGSYRCSDTTIINVSKQHAVIQLFCVVLQNLLLGAQKLSQRLVARGVQLTTQCSKMAIHVN